MQNGFSGVCIHSRRTYSHSNCAILRFQTRGLVITSVNISLRSSMGSWLSFYREAPPLGTMCETRSETCAASTEVRVLEEHGWRKVFSTFDDEDYEPRAVVDVNPEVPVALANAIRRVAPLLRRTCDAGQSHHGGHNDCEACIYIAPPGNIGHPLAEYCDGIASTGLILDAASAVEYIDRRIIGISARYEFLQSSGLPTEVCGSGLMEALGQHGEVSNFVSDFASAHLSIAWLWTLHSESTADNPEEELYHAAVIIRHDTL